MHRIAVSANRHSFPSLIAAPLTDAQKQLWLLAQRDDRASRAYNVPVILSLRGCLHVRAMRQAIQDAVDRHEALRTTISADGQEQRISQGMAFEVPLVDFSGVAPIDSSRRLTDFLETQSNGLFDLTQGPLFRATLVKLGQHDHVLALVAHHIIVDGWSIGVLVRDIASDYTARVSGSRLEKERPLQFREYASWHNDRLDDRAMQDHESYWLEHLSGPLPQLELTSKPRPPVMTFRGARCSIKLEAGLVKSLNELSQQNNCTLFMTLLAVYLILLRRLSGQGDLIAGVPVSKRALKGGGDLVGYCVNVVPLRFQSCANPSFKEHLATLRNIVIEAYQHADYPFAKLVSKLNVPRDPSRPQLVGTIFNMNAPLAAGLTLPELDVGLMSCPIAYARHDVSVNVIPVRDELVLEVDYNTDLFDAAAIEGFAQRMATLCEAVVSDPEQRVSNLPILTEKERQQLLVELNATQVDFPRGLCLHQLFEAQVGRTPEVTAVVFENQSLTYAELDARANQLAHHLRTLGVGPEVPVGICMERSIEMIVSLFGILKAGGAYVPLDTDYPEDRLGFMLRDTRAPVVLTQHRLRDRLPACDALKLALDREWGLISTAPSSKPTVRVTPQNLAYVIYTSGSTGKPKGASIPHAGIVNRLLWMQDAYGLDATDRVLQKTPFSFDVSVWEFFWPLMTGARLVVAKPGGHKDSRYLAELIAEAQVTTLHFVPPMLAVFLEEPGIEACRSLRRVICSGEALPFELTQRHYARLEVPLHNLYGPTEASVDVTHWTCERDSTLSVVPIGRPIANTQMYILDAELNPLPLGVTGDLYIGGVGLGRGYLGRPDLTAEKFIPDPFSNVAGARLYRTGDLARYLPDGNIEFLGRSDHQVKIRGFRIELGEIEATLAQHPAVREVVVVARDDGPGDKRLVAYLVPTPDAQPGISAWRAFLKDKVPDYMVPAAFVCLDALPLSHNGKVDRKALPAPEVRPEADQDHVAPRNPTEKHIAEIWAQVLGIERVGIHANFFELGGDSILAIQIIARANQAGFKLTPQRLFEHPTVAGLAGIAGVARTIQAEQGVVTGPVPLTPIQHGFFELDLPIPQHFNQSVLLEVLAPLKPTLLERAIQHLIEHHDGLRMRFERAASGWQQANAKTETRQVFCEIDLSSYPTSERRATLEVKAADLQASLDLQNGPLMRAALFRMGSHEPDRLLLAIHHLVVDGVSWRILLSDLNTLYRQLEAGHVAVLPPKTTSFKQWAERLRSYAQSKHVHEELGHWLALADEPLRPLPIDMSGGPNTFARARTVTVSLTAQETQALLQEAPQAYQTQVNDLLLTALAQTLSSWSGAQALWLDLEGHGREPIFDDLDLTRTVGWFTTLFPVRLDLPHTSGPGEVIKAIKEQLRGVPQKGLGYGVLRYLADPAARAALDTVPQPQIRFNYLGQFDQVLHDAPFRLAREDRGPEHSRSEPCRYLFDINGSIVDDQLSMGWTFSDQRYRRETVERLAHGYIAALRGLIQHCLAPEAGGYTPSDFAGVGLSQSDLDQLLVDYDAAFAEH